MSFCLLGLGSNLGNPRQSLDDALDRLEHAPGVELLRRSRYVETSPAGGPAGQSAYLNATGIVRTSLSPRELLHTCQAIENDLGRRRIEHWGPRTIDIDLLLADDLVIDTAELKIPHPRMTWRRFVLAPAAEIAGDMIHPLVGQSIARLLAHLNSTPWYVALAGPIAVGKTRLAEDIARQSGARLLADTVDPALLATFYHNPSFHGPRTQLEFLHRRAAQLDREDPEWAQAERPTVSDYWFDQSAAFARVWLPPEKLTMFVESWRKARARVAEPRLIAILTAPRERLMARIRERGRPGEDRLTDEQSRRLDEALAQQLAATEGPILRLDATDQPAALVELTAAMQAMH